MYNVIINKTYVMNGMERVKFMELKILNLVSAMHILGNIWFMVPDAMQQIKKLKIQTGRIWPERSTFCKWGSQKIGYGEDAIRYMPADGFCAEYRGKP